VLVDMLASRWDVDTLVGSRKRGCGLFNALADLQLVPEAKHRKQPTDAGLTTYDREIAAPLSSPSQAARKRERHSGVHEHQPFEVDD
jgi:hypothetical protein